MLHRCTDAEAVSQAAAQFFAQQAQSAIAARGRFTVVLSGGKTPQRLYEILADKPYIDQIGWKYIQFFWGDERCVALDDPQSNYAMAQKALLTHLSIDPKQIHAINAGLSPQDAAQQYESELRKFFRSQSPQFDLILLGLGDNGHTASLFPHSEVLHESEHWVSAVHVADAEPPDRITLTAPLLNQASRIAFLVTGAAKADVLNRIINGSADFENLPAQLIHLNQTELDWFIDTAAAQKLCDVKLMAP